MSDEELASERKLAHEKAAAAAASGAGSGVAAGSSRGIAVLFWLLVGVPLAWGVWVTVTKALILFK
jgi:hypothetical protein